MKLTSETFFWVFSTLFVILPGEVEAKAPCFSNGSIIGAVLGTFFSTLAVALIVGFILLRRKSNNSPAAAPVTANKKKGTDVEAPVVKYEASAAKSPAVPGLTSYLECREQSYLPQNKKNDNGNGKPAERDYRTPTATPTAEISISKPVQSNIIANDESDVVIIPYEEDGDRGIELSKNFNHETVVTKVDQASPSSGKLSGGDTITAIIFQTKEMTLDDLNNLLAMPYPAALRVTRRPPGIPVSQLDIHSENNGSVSRLEISTNRTYAAPEYLSAIKTSGTEPNSSAVIVDSEIRQKKDQLVSRSDINVSETNAVASDDFKLVNQPSKVDSEEFVIAMDTPEFSNSVDTKASVEHEIQFPKARLEGTHKVPAAEVEVDGKHNLDVSGQYEIPTAKIEMDTSNDQVLDVADFMATNEQSLETESAFVDNAIKHGYKYSVDPGVADYEVVGRPLKMNESNESDFDSNIDQAGHIETIDEIKVDGLEIPLRKIEMSKSKDLDIPDFMTTNKLDEHALKLGYKYSGDPGVSEYKITGMPLKIDGPEEVKFESHIDQDRHVEIPGINEVEGLDRPTGHLSVGKQGHRSHSLDYSPGSFENNSSISLAKNKFPNTYNLSEISEINSSISLAKDKFPDTDELNEISDADVKYKISKMPYNSASIVVDSDPTSDPLKIKSNKNGQMAEADDIVEGEGNADGSDIHIRSLMPLRRVAKGIAEVEPEFNPHISVSDSEREVSLTSQYLECISDHVDNNDDTLKLKLSNDMRGVNAELDSSRPELDSLKLDDINAEINTSKQKLISCVAIDTPEIQQTLIADSSMASDSKTTVDLKPVGLDLTSDAKARDVQLEVDARPIISTCAASESSSISASASANVPDMAPTVSKSTVELRTTPIVATSGSQSATLAGTKPGSPDAKNTTDAKSKSGIGAKLKGLFQSGKKSSKEEKQRKSSTDIELGAPGSPSNKETLSLSSPVISSSAIQIIDPCAPEANHQSMNAELIARELAAKSSDFEPVVAVSNKNIAVTNVKVASEQPVWTEVKPVEISVPDITEIDGIGLEVITHPEPTEGRHFEDTEDIQLESSAINSQQRVKKNSGNTHNEGTISDNVANVGAGKSHENSLSIPVGLSNDIQGTIPDDASSNQIAETDKRETHSFLTYKEPGSLEQENLDHLSDTLDDSDLEFGQTVVGLPPTGKTSEPDDTARIESSTSDELRNSIVITFPEEQLDLTKDCLLVQPPDSTHFSNANMPSPKQIDFDESNHTEDKWKASANESDMSQPHSVEGTKAPASESEAINLSTEEEIKAFSNEGDVGLVKPLKEEEEKPPGSENDLLKPPTDEVNKSSAIAEHANRDGNAMVRIRKVSFVEPEGVIVEETPSGPVKTVKTPPPEPKIEKKKKGFFHLNFGRKSKSDVKAGQKSPTASALKSPSLGSPSPTLIEADKVVLSAASYPSEHILSSDVQNELDRVDNKTSINPILSTFTTAARADVEFPDLGKHAVSSEVPVSPSVQAELDRVDKRLMQTTQHAPKDTVPDEQFHKETVVTTTTSDDQDVGTETGLPWNDLELSNERPDRSVHINGVQIHSSNRKINSDDMILEIEPVETASREPESVNINDENFENGNTEMHLNSQDRGLPDNLAMEISHNLVMATSQDNDNQVPSISYDMPEIEADNTRFDSGRTVLSIKNLADENANAIARDVEDRQQIDIITKANNIDSVLNANMHGGNAKSDSKDELHNLQSDEELATFRLAQSDNVLRSINFPGDHSRQTIVVHENSITQQVEGLTESDLRMLNANRDSSKPEIDPTWLESGFLGEVQSKRNDLAQSGILITSNGLKSDIPFGGSDRIFNGMHAKLHRDNSQDTFYTARDGNDTDIDNITVTSSIDEDDGDASFTSFENDRVLFQGSLIQPSQQADLQTYGRERGPSDGGSEEEAASDYNDARESTEEETESDEAYGPDGRRPSEDLEKFYFGMSKTYEDTDTQDTGTLKAVKPKSNAGSTPFTLSETRLAANRTDQTPTSRLEMGGKMESRNNRVAVEPAEFSHPQTIRLTAGQTSTSDTLRSHDSGYHEHQLSNFDLSELVLEPLELPSDVIAGAEQYATHTGSTAVTSAEDDVGYDWKPEKYENNRPDYRQEVTGKSSYSIRLHRPEQKEPETRTNLKLVKSSDYIYKESKSRKDEDTNNNFHAGQK